MKHKKFNIGTFDEYIRCYFPNSVDMHKERTELLRKVNKLIGKMSVDELKYLEQLINTRIRSEWSEDTNN